MAKLSLLLAGLGGVDALKVTNGDTCGCMSYHHVYKSGLANCGDGGESGEVPGSYCTLINDRPIVFFPMQNHSYCLRFDTPKDPKNSWCYVSSACENLNGGRAVNGNVSMKVCGEGDAKLGDLRPQELMNVFPWDPQLAGFFAYQASEPGQPLEQVGPCKRTPGQIIDGEMQNLVECDNGEKWQTYPGFMKCMAGPCPAGLEVGIDRLPMKPRVEAWMYGEAGPPPQGNPDGESVMRYQSEANSYYLGD